MIRNLSDDERKITSTNTQKFITQAPLGSVIRIASARRDTDNHHGLFDTDSVGHFTDKTTGQTYYLATRKEKEGHNMVIVAKSSSGFTFIENLNSGLSEQTLTWSQFANKYASKYIYFKYIKYPNAPAYTTYDVSSIELRDIVYPATFKINTTNGWNLSGGLVISNAELKSIDAKIIGSNNQVISAMKSPKPISGKVYPIKSLDGKNVDNGQKFSKISSNGNYKWIITATDSNNQSVTLEMPIKAVTSGSTATEKASKANVIVPSIPAYSNLEFQNVTCPTNYKVGTSGGYKLTGGTLVSNEELKTITSTIKKTDGTVISGPKTRNISGKSYNIQSLDTYETSDNGVHFSWIKTAGNYVWILTATDASGKTLTLEMPFTASSNATTSTTRSIGWTAKIAVTGVSLDQSSLVIKKMRQQRWQLQFLLTTQQTKVYPGAAIILL